METSSVTKILVVEDSAAQRMMLKLTLELESFQVITANNGIDGVNKAFALQPDLIISDVVMPELNGYQLCHLLKHDPATQHIPIILLSNIDKKKNEFWAVESGANAFISKSTRQDILVAKVRELLAENPRVDRQSTDGQIGVFEQESVASQINHILDKLLFESTVSNRIRETVKFIHDPPTLIQQFFLLLNQLLNYTVAGVVIEQPKQTYIYNHIAKTCNSNHFEQIRQDVINELDENYQKNKIKTNKWGEQLLVEQDTPLLITKIYIPLEMHEQTHGWLFLYDDASTVYSAETDQMLRTISKELSMLLQYVLQLEANESIKADFTSMIVHDLRSPMTGIFGLLKLLQEGRIGDVNDKQKEILGQILGTINKLLTLVSDVLDLSKIEAGRLEIHPQPVSLHDIVNLVIRNVQVLADEKDIDIVNTYSPTASPVIADMLRIEQVFMNLLSNAIKYSRAGGLITVGNAVVDEDSVSPKMKIWVKDKGVGISETDLPHLFEKYQQAGNARQYRKKGTGLGLVICKMVIQAHGGEIWAESEENVGSTFYFTLPMAEEIHSVVQQVNSTEGLAHEQG
ncbi:hybrid sensor histidine kinase/response regulator [candidate division KSB1 bacterium]|nr:hybrid sensor histidine kinase/response regulator [candidate division KSB1 bacterium]